MVSHSLSTTNDTDGDGLLDGWMWQHFGHVQGLEADQTRPQDDYDGDGVGNLTEFYAGTDPNTIRFSFSLASERTSSSVIAGHITVFGGIPGGVALIVDSNATTQVSWTAFQADPMLDLGASEGWHFVSLGARGLPEDAEQTWRVYRVKLDHTAPQLTVTAPLPGPVSRPVLQLQGQSQEPLRYLTYDLANSEGAWANQQAFITSSDYDTNTWEVTATTFRCFDVLLAAGSNTIIFHATDLAGNVTNYSVNYSLDVSNATAPAITIYWPADKAQVSGDTFTLRGCLNDPTATVVVSASNGLAASGQVGRDGLFCVPNLPLAPGTNYLILTATNAAGLSNAVNLAVVKSSVSLSIPGLPSQTLGPGPIFVFGTIDSPDYSVWVNGVKADLDGFGGWIAEAVPINQDAALVVQARAIPNSDNSGNGTGGGAPPTFADLGNPASGGALDAESDNDRPPYGPFVQDFLCYAVIKEFIDIWTCYSAA